MSNVHKFMNILKGDQVKIIAGKDKGKSGEVSKVLPQAERIVVHGVNMFKKRSRPKRQGEKGEVVMVAKPLSASNAMVICKNCKKATRVGRRMHDGQKVRYCKQCDANL